MAGQNYRVQTGCHNCKHVFVKYEWDSHNEYFCTLNAPPRPHCGSVAMHEEKKGAGDDYDYEAWEDWSHCRNVKGIGICEEFKIKPTDK